MKEDAQGYGYSYVSEENILSHITGVMQRVGISLIPSVVPGSWSFEPHVYEKKKTDKAGNVTADTVCEFLFKAEMTFRWVNDENPEDSILVTWPIGNNSSDMAQSEGGALTYGTRYFLLKFFNCVTSKDDPDALLRNIAAGAADEAALKEMVAQIDAAFKQIPAEDKEKRAAVAVAITPIIQKDTGKKSANYMTLKTLEAAAEVFAAVQKILGEAGG
ncbi:MAG: ERF family protein [Oscillospiraceae bacterium]|nr:ERF family protein [Oscillospiraceae bacterium]